MRCPDCSKFVSLEEMEPEVESIELSDDGEQVNAEVRICNACADCGTELKEANFSIEHTLGDQGGDHESTSQFEQGQALSDHQGEGHELEVEETGANRDSFQTGKGRRAPTMYGAEVQFTVSCSCLKGKPVATGTLREYEQAGAMDELT
jgi:hypothetical protein